MNGVLRVARTEVLEQWRQPAMLLILVANYALWLGLFGVGFWRLDALQADPDSYAALTRQLQALGVELNAVVRVGSSTFGSVLFTNLPLFVAISAGTSVLHDRESGTLPFLMLAPLTRPQLLLGKLLGVLAIPTLLHFAFVGVGCAALGQLHLLHDAAAVSLSGAWWVAFALGAPASGALVGALGTIISALSRDARTSMQHTSFWISLLSLGFGAALVDGLSWGVPAQLAFAVLCVGLALVALLVGARLISRDVTA